MNVQRFIEQRAAELEKAPNVVDYIIDGVFYNEQWMLDHLAWRVHEQHADDEPEFEELTVKARDMKPGDRLGGDTITRVDGTTIRGRNTQFGVLDRPLDLSPGDKVTVRREV